MALDLQLGSGVFIPNENAVYGPLSQTLNSICQWMSFNVSQLEPTKGNFTFTYHNTLVNNMLAIGQVPFVHFWVDAPWMNGHGGMPSYPPNSETHWADWKEFCRQVAIEFKGRVTRYGIGEEFHAPVYWMGTIDEYIRLLRLAYEAIKTEDPNAIVEDSGMSHEGTGVIVADLMFDDDPQGAVDWMREYFRIWHQEMKPSTPEQLRRVMRDTGWYRMPQWQSALMNNLPLMDIQQFHLFTEWKAQRYAMRRLRAYHNKKFDLWEAGIAKSGFPRGEAGELEWAARELAKLIVVGFGEGAEAYIQWTSSPRAEGYSGEDHAALFTDPLYPNPMAPTWRPGAYAFQYLAGLLNHSTAAAPLTWLEPTWAGYRFQTPTGSVVIAWSADGTTRNCPWCHTPGTPLRTTDIYGNETLITAMSVPLGDSPTCIFEGAS